MLSSFLPQRHTAFLALVAASLLAAPCLRAQTSFSVGGGGAYTSIQAAVNACPVDGCSIQLTDSVYALPREIWIEGKTNLSIQPSTALVTAGIKPRLFTEANLLTLAGTAMDSADPKRPAGWRKWPNSCTTGAGSSKDSTNPNSTTGYESNGLIVILDSRDILIEGLQLDGHAPTYFLNKGVWDCKWDLLFGNVGFNLLESHRVILRGNDIHGFFSGIHIRGRNPGGAYAQGTLAGTAAGTVGEHLVEGNRIHGNWWAVFDEAEWDLGTTFRYNLAYANANTEYAASTTVSSEANNMAGGFLYLKDVLQTTHRIHNNTIFGAPLILGQGGFNVGVQHLFYNNIVAGFSSITDPLLRAMVQDWRQLLSDYEFWIEDNLFEIEDSTRFQVQSYTSAQISDSAVCKAKSQMSPCFLPLDQPIRITSDIFWPWGGWMVTSQKVPQVAIAGGKQVVVTLHSVESLPHGGVINGMFGAGNGVKDVTAADNRWMRHVPWQSLDTLSPSFLAPEWSDSFAASFFKSQGRTASGWPTSDPSPDTDVGAITSTAPPSALWGAHSQEPVSILGGGNCFKIPTRAGSGTPHLGVRVHRVQAWRVPFGQSIVSSTALPINSVEDSSYVEGGSLTVCVPPSSLVDSSGLRFQVEWSGISSATARQELSEPAYYLMASPKRTWTTGTAPRVRTASSLRVLRTGSGLAAIGLPSGEFEIEVRSLDGRALHRGHLSSQAGVVAIPLASGSSRPLLVRIRQGDWRTQAIVPAL